MKTLSIIVSLFWAFLSVKANNELKLWFDKPAEFFEESFVMGNGRMGAVIHGGVQSDMIYLNDAELWAGEPFDNDENIGAFQHIKSIREALDAENYPLAEELLHSLHGKFTFSYSPL